MAKKNFSGGIDRLFQDSQKEDIVDSNSNNKQKRLEDTRTTIIIHTETYEKIKAIAYWERKQIKDLVEKSFKLLLNQYSESELSKIVNRFRKDNP
jgi:hypothetical protein